MSSPPWTRMPPKTVAREPVLLRERHCHRSACQKLFYLCPSCDRGQRYCSPQCRAEARRRQHRAASARYQSSPEGRRSHREWQNAYRQRCRARSPARLVTDPSSTFPHSGSFCGSDAPRPLPQSQSKLPPRTPQPRASHVPWRGLRCLVCRCPGFLQANPYEPDYSPKYP